MKKAFFILMIVLLSNTFIYAQTNEELNCPSISITSPAERVFSGEEITFTANISGTDLQKHEIVWSVDKGKIIQGQGTQIVIVSTQGLSQELITAKVKLENVQIGCANSAYGSGVVSKLIENFDPDEFGELSEKEVKNRIDNLLIRLANDKNAMLYIVNYGSLEKVNARKNLVANHIKLRKFDESQVVFVDGGREESIKTRPWSMSCKSIFVNAPKAAVTSGEAMVFSISMDQNLYYSNINYKWTVDKGAIIRGQGTDLIVVDTTGFGDEVINATVEIEGLPKQCKNSFTETGIVASELIGCVLDELGNLEDGDVQARIDNLFIRLMGDSNAKAFIINYGPRKDVIDRDNLIKTHIKSRGYDMSKIVFQYKGEESEIRTRLWIVPEGADASELN